MKYTITPYLKNMTIDDSCYFALELINDNINVCYYNPKEDKDFEYPSFKEFSDASFDNVYISDAEKFEEKTNNTETKTFIFIESVDDYDEEARRCFKTFETKVESARTLHNIKAEDLEKEVEKFYKEISEQVHEQLCIYKENLLFEKDPYKYYGVSKKDFY